MSRSAPSETNVAASPSSVSSAPRRAWLWGLGAGVVAGLAAWAVGEAFFGRFDVPVRPALASGPTPELAAAFLLEDIRADRLNGAVAFGALGAALGLALGLAGGQARGSLRAAVGAGLLGLVLAGLAGAAALVALVPYYHAHFNRDAEDFLTPLLVHAGCYAAIGLGAGLALGAGWGGGGRTLRAAVGGLFGGLLGAMLAELGGILIFPLAKTTNLIATAAVARLFTRLVVTLAVVVGAVVAAQDAAPRRPRDAGTVPAAPQAPPPPEV